MEDKLFYYNAKVTRVVDGDTMDVEIDTGFSTWKKTRIRLDRINAYETKLYKGVTEEEKLKGLEAKKLMEDIIATVGGNVFLHTTYKDKYGRWVAEMWIGDKNASDLLLEKSLAVLAQY